MSIKLIDSKVVCDEAPERISQQQLRHWEEREKVALEKKQFYLESLEESRRQMSLLKQHRANKESLIERFETKIKDVEKRLKIAEERRDLNLKDTRLDQLAKEKEKKMMDEMARLYASQAMHHNKVLDGIYTTELLDKLLNVIYEREHRIEERMKHSKDELLYQVNRQDELKVNIRKKISSIKEKHAQIFELEPKIKESIAKNQEKNANLAELQTRIKKVEDEVIYFEKERKRLIMELEKSSVDCGQKQKRSIKPPPQIEALKKFSAPKKPIAVYKVNKPEVVKAFETFTKVYGNVQKV